MTTEHKFIASFTSTWHNIMPLADKYWRTENLLVAKATGAVENKSPIKMRGFINELAFNAFCTSRSDPTQNIDTIIADEIEKTLSYIKRLDPTKDLQSSDVDLTCLSEVKSLVRNMEIYFHPSKKLILRPKFQGCGMISNCEGDIIDGTILYEIKAGDRNFRITDIRQLFLYSALAFASGKNTFANIGLFNPRTGKAWVRDINKIATQISGRSGNDVLLSIVQSLTPSEPSR